LSDAISKRGSLYQLQHECLDAVGVLKPVDRRDVGMIQGGQDFRLALEAGEPLRISGHRGGQHLDGDRPFQVGVNGSVDLTHPAHADLGDDFISTEARARS